MDTSNSCPRSLLDFRGYGNPNSSCWFIGMEESLDEAKMPLHLNIEVRVRHFTPVMDLHESVRLLGSPITRLAMPNTSTWPWMAKLVRGLVDGKQDWPDRKLAREFIVSRLGRLDGTSFLAEMLPLPKRQDGAWPTLYARWWATRQDYEKDVLHSRIRLLQELVSEYRPRWVIAYGKRHHDAYKQIFPIHRWVKKDVGRSCIEIGEAQDHSTRVVLSPFFGNGAFGRRHASMIIESLLR